jgi:hypothetical protein
MSALNSHPNVLARMHTEVAALWFPVNGEPITLEHIEAMRYMQAVAREVVPTDDTGAAPDGEASIGGGEVEDEVVREHVTTPARDDHHVVTVIFASGGGNIEHPVGIKKPRAT